MTNELAGPGNHDPRVSRRGDAHPAAAGVLNHGAVINFFTASLTSVLLYGFSYVFASLGLWISVVAQSFVATVWLLLAYYSLRNVRDAQFPDQPLSFVNAGLLRRLDARHRVFDLESCPPAPAAGLIRRVSAAWFVVSCPVRTRGRGASAVRFGCRRCHGETDRDRQAGAENNVLW